MTILCCTPHRVGFHAKPSMKHLHLHVISVDFISPFLKTKKHWNSFNTRHFVLLSGENKHKRFSPTWTTKLPFYSHSIADIIKDLEDNGVVSLPSDEQIKEYMESQLKCNQCEYEAKTMPKLKTHLLEHNSGTTSET